ncbi:reverse transcriptase [Phytophthora megakarya]|uniref:Reverse transcriptase n=1 Tax=Phytophthora megakarya TaxID=4795 RepID=A0A225WCE8_9STRA|nr:reverse transcriptase [Phytophthora megakarya]
MAMLNGDGSHPSSLVGVESGTGHKLGDPLDQNDAESMTQKKNEDPAADLDRTWDSDQDYDECVYYPEGSDLYAEDVDGQLAVLPKVPITTEDVRIEDIQLRRKNLPTPSADLEDPTSPDRQGKCGSRLIALKCRKLRIQFREKLAELIKGLLSAKMINHSRSPLASPIVVIIKKNGVNIKLCIDYRLINRINSLTQLMAYPMPLINDLLEDLKSTLWYCSLNMTSGFWVVKMTDRARLTSVFITPFGLVEWNRMPFGLKNAPQIYQRMIDNARYGFTRIPKMAGDLERLDVFEAGEPEDPGKPSVLGRRSYIDVIVVPADNWGQLCDRVEDLLEACDKWNMSISVVKSFWGIPKMEYLGHNVSPNGLEVNPKDLSTLTDLKFPGSLPAILNYYIRFIEDYAIYASVLYELREIDYAAMEKGMNQGWIHLALASESPDSFILTKDPTSPQSSDTDLRGPDPELSTQDPNLVTRDPMPDCVKVSNSEKDIFTDLDTWWIHAHRSVKVLKEKIAKTLILRHFDPVRQAVVVVYASDWAISGALMQEYDQIYYPVMFASLQRIKLRDSGERSLALLRILDLNYNTLVGRPIRVLTRHSTLTSLLRSNALPDRLGQWAALVSPSILEIVKCSKGEDEILGTLAASITPRSKVDKALISIAPKKEPRCKRGSVCRLIRRIRQRQARWRHLQSDPVEITSVDSGEDQIRLCRRFNCQ